MSGLAVGTVVAIFSDPSGKRTRCRINVDNHLSTVAAAQTNATGILDPMQLISKLKFESANLVIPLAIDKTGYKSTPGDTASWKKAGWLEYITDIPDGQKAAHARLWIPSPLAAKLAGNADRINLADTAITSLITFMKNNACGLNGQAIVNVGESGVRVRVARK